MTKIRSTKKIIKLAISVMIIVFFLISPFFWTSKLSNFELLASKSYDNGFLTVWNIDDFEGGSGNRTDFLEKIAKQFEAKNKGWYVNVKSITSQDAYNSIVAGTTPDLLSFSHYSATTFQNILHNLDFDTGVRSDLLEYAKLDGKIKAIPWYVSGYCLIGNLELNSQLADTLSTKTMFSYSTTKGKKEIASVSVGLSNNNMALLACIKNGIEYASTKDIVSDYTQKTTFEAYNDFCNNQNSVVLLGTARDYYRVYNKINNGNMSNCSFIPLGEWTDLIGYMGVCTTNENNYQKALDFVSYLTSNDAQQQLSKIGLFSSRYLEIYKNDEHYSKFEQVLQRKIKSINIFTPQDIKTKMWENSINAIFGNKDSVNYVKQFL